MSVSLGRYGVSGVPEIKEVYSFKFSTNQWTKKADMIHSTGKYGTCGLITTESGEKEIVTTISKTVEIYNIATDTWREGKDLSYALDISFLRNGHLLFSGNNFPTRMRAHTTARYGDTFLVVAGHNDDGSNQDEQK